MENQIPFWLYLVTFIFSVAMVLKMRKKQGDTIKLPPAPRKLPFIGNLHLFIRRLPHHCLRDLAKIYGPIMHLQFGEIPVYIFSSKQVVEDVMKTNDIIFANRPSLHALKLLTYDYTDVSMASYGVYWRQVRKICVLELLSSSRVRSFKSIREDEVSNLIRDISSNSRSIIEIGKMVTSLGMSITSRAAFGGKSKHQEEFKKMAPDILAFFAGLSLIDLFPSFKLLHLIHAIRLKWTKLHKRVDEIVESIIVEHRAKRAKGWTERGDLVHVLLDIQDHGELEIPLTTNNIKAIIMDMFLSADTSSITVVWAMSEMIKNSKVIEMAQTEIRHVFAGKGGVDEAQLDELKYLNLVIKETLRLHPPAPLFSRESIKGCEINGYEIPTKSRVLINIWALGRDPDCWTKPDKFLPERFLNNTKDYNGSCFDFLPFGGGRRICPGISFGIAMVRIMLANLLYHFDWKLPQGEKPEDLDMTEALSTFSRRKCELRLIPIPYHPMHSQ